MSYRPPNLALALSDAPRAIIDMALLHQARPLLNLLPKTRKTHSVMVIPGFQAHESGYSPLIRFLRSRGYYAKGWGQGRNDGPDHISEERIESAFEPLLESGGGKVSLVGHSLGGIYAREFARAKPEWVHSVITLGSPFGEGNEMASHASRQFHRMNPNTNPDDGKIVSTPPPVPTTAIFTKGDGIVNWRVTRQSGNDHHVHNIEVPGSHIGMHMNAAVWFWIVRKLAEVDAQIL